MKTTANTADEPTVTWVLEAKFKDLTDEELTQLYVDFEENYTGTNFPVDLGRAILRKAQEK